jgi:hypothetical protein
VGAPGWSDARAILQQAAQRHPWDSKIPKLFFRGGWTQDGRGVLFEHKAIKDSELADVKFTSPFKKDAKASRGALTDRPRGLGP